MVLCDPLDWPARFSDLEVHRDSLSGFPSPAPLAHSLRCSGAAGHRPRSRAGGLQLARDRLLCIIAGRGPADGGRRGAAWTQGTGLAGPKVKPMQRVSSFWLAASEEVGGGSDSASGPGPKLLFGWQLR